MNPIFMSMVQSHSAYPHPVIPAKTGIQEAEFEWLPLDPRIRGGDAELYRL